MVSWSAEIKLIDVWMASKDSSLSLNRSGKSHVRVERPVGRKNGTERAGKMRKD
jgi:hypothetical protein